MSKLFTDEVYENAKDEVLSDIDHRVESNNNNIEYNKPLLGMIYDMREPDAYYDYLRQYDGGKFYERHKQDIVAGQLFNKKTKIYNNVYSGEKAKLYTGLAEDIIKGFVAKVFTTNLREFNSKGEVVDGNMLEDINPKVITDILTGMVKYGRGLIVFTDWNEYDVKKPINGDVKVVGSKKAINSVRVFAPYQFDAKKGVILYKKNQQVNEKSYKDTLHYEFNVGEPLLENKEDLVYLVDFLITNFGIEIEGSRLNIHIDNRFGQNFGSEIYTLYNNIPSGGVNELPPLWEYKQGDMRPAEYDLALDKLIMMISRSFGFTLRDIIFNTATQSVLKSQDEVNQINKWLEIFSFELNKVIRTATKSENYLKYDEHSPDSLDSKLERLRLMYQGGGLEYEVYVNEVYRLMNLGKPNVEIMKTENGILQPDENGVDPVEEYLNAET